MPDLETGKPYGWEARLPEIKEMAKGGKVVLGWISELQFEFRDNESQLQFDRVLRDILAEVDYSENADPFREIDAIERRVSSAVFEGCGFVREGQYLLKDFNSTLRYAFINLLMELHNQSSSTEISDVSAKTRGDLKV